MNPELTMAARLRDRQICLCPMLRLQAYCHHTRFLKQKFRELNTGSHARVTSTLLTQVFITYFIPIILQQSLVMCSRNL